MKSKVKIPLIIVLVLSVLVFIYLCIQISNPNSSLALLDKKINSNMYNIQIPSLLTLGNLIAYAFDTLTIVIISFFVGLMLVYKKKNKVGAFFLGTILFTALVTYLLKRFIAVARPLNILLPQSSYSFPSGHTTTAVVFFGLIAFYLVKRSKSRLQKLSSIIFPTLLILIIGFSRMYINAHWFSDVLGGFCVGLFILALSLLIWEKRN